MQLQDLVKPIDEMSDEALRERIRLLRHTRTVSRPAAKHHAKKAEAKGRVTRVTKVANLFAGFTPEQLQALMDDLESGNG